MESGREPLVIENTLEHPIASKLIPTQQLGIKSFLGVPIILEDGTLFGNICAVDKNPFTFTKENEIFVKSMAGLFAYVIELEHSAFIDSLTGLKNRRFVNELVSNNYDTYAVLFIDVDHFKQVNDLYGHEIGDLVLIEIGNRLKDMISKEDSAIRLAGDEFLLILPGCSYEEAEQMGRSFLTHLSKPIETEELSFSVSASIGISCYPQNGNTLKALIKHADTAMYAAKEQGKGTLEHYTEELKRKKINYLAKPLVCAALPANESTLLKEKSVVFMNRQKKVLEMVLQEQPLNDILDYLAKWAENHTIGHFTSILLFNKKKNMLEVGAAPSLPESFNAKLNHLPIGPNIGSCGTAAYYKELVISENIHEDPKWVNYKSIALQCGLQSCWSIPILSSKKQILGTFAMYSCVPKKPSEEDIYFIESMSYLISLAIERNALVNHLGQISDRDLLTGLYNRASFYEHMEKLSNSETQSSNVALLFINVDRFKNINHSMGLYIGDYVLKETAIRLLNLVDQKRHKVFRIDGDEFVVLLHLKPGDSPSKIGQDILSGFKKSIKYGKYEFNIQVRIGMSRYVHGEQVENLVNKGMKALNLAKKSGGLYIETQVPYLSQDHERFILENDLRKAIKRRELYLMYQPQYDINSLKMVGIEALIRWHHPEKGEISPVEFIPLAEESGLITPIGNWVLVTICHQITEWKANGYIIPKVSINLSPIQFENEQFIKTIMDTLALTGCDATSLTFEITESVTMDITRTMSLFNELNELNIKISVDDFGTGYSSLRYLDQLPIDQLKIDKSFIQNEKKRAIVKSIVEMAHNLNIEVVAEGVETIEQLEFLRDMECTIVQGFYLSKPIIEIEELLERNCP